MGGREGYDGPLFGLREVTKAIQKFQQAQNGDYCTCRISSCEYVAAEYHEHGFQISVINYLRFQKSDNQIIRFSLELGKFLLAELKQNRVTVLTPIHTYLFESDNPEDHPNALTPPT